MSAEGNGHGTNGALPPLQPDILHRIIAEVADLAIVVDTGGRIASVIARPDRGGQPSRIDRWEGRDLRETLTVESVPKFSDRLEEFLSAGRLDRTVELNHTDGFGTRELPVRYSFHRIGEDRVLLLGRDLRPIAEIQQQLVKAQLALERDYETQREFDTRFRVLMESMREAVLFVSLGSGRITEANGNAQQLIGRSRDELVGASFVAEVHPAKRGELLDDLANQALSQSGAPMMATLTRSGDTVTLTPTLFRSAGDRILLLRLEPQSAAPAAPGSLARNLAALYQAGPDAIVFIQSDGAILSANEAFLDLIDATHDLNVKGRSLADYLARGTVDLKVLTENALRSGRMRLYPTKLSGEYGSPRSVEIAATTIETGVGHVFALVIRDASRIETMRPVSAPVTDDNVRSVMELVGSATLKEIVAETTNVIERMCIETAVELTMNNRVAAAEMLGLSRQSLYVKLRKYGLLERGESAEE